MRVLKLDAVDDWPAWLKTTEVAALLGTTRMTVRSMISRGELKGCIQVGREWRIPADELRRLIASGSWEGPTE